jgi:poly-gamma-glutamate synthase PgsB/CapB
VQTAFARAVAEASGVSIEMIPFEFDGRAPKALPVPVQRASSRPPRAGAAMVLLQGALGHDPIARIQELWRDVADYAASPGGNRLPHLAAYGGLLLGAFLFRAVAIRESVERDRAAIPLVIGGWGTRGKSGTERLKAAMLQGLGHECLVKTTGCEAMFIHAIPGVPAREVFIYRPYDKATVWEQRHVLRLARGFGVRAFFWECMALQPDLVNLLQSQWMRDDYSTITNAYPDHEDVQGPSGLDVAATISEFVPLRGTLLTSEDQMLPLLRERARGRSIRLHTVGVREEELVSSDLLARFGHLEHPRNVALAASLAARLGVPREVAIAEMADNVVPDLGVLKTYPTVPWRGRMITFTNGMGANDRAGTLGSWRRSGFDAHEVDAEPARWIVTVVNNRADRILRSEVFGKLVVDDISAHRHVIIGTNVSGLLGFIRDALERHIESSLPCRDLSGDEDERRETAGGRIVTAFARLKVGRTDAGSVLAECEALGLPPPGRATIERLLLAEHAAESYDAGLRIVKEALGAYPQGEALPFVAAAIARRRAVSRILRLANAKALVEPAVVDRAFREAYRAMFMESVVPLHDSTLSGDAVIDRIAQAVPPGARAAVMGIQNIKGTGMDFVYRWVSVDALHGMLEQLRNPSGEARTSALVRLLTHDSYGLVDSAFVLEAVEQARALDADADQRPYDAVIAQLRAIREARASDLSVRKAPRLADRVRREIGETFDFLDSVWRRRMAERVLDELVEGRISHGSAAARMRSLVARTKGGWMRGKQAAGS